MLFFFSYCDKKESRSLKKIVIETGKSTWYGPGFHGKRTANGEKFNMNALTAAHKQLEFGTFVRVINLENDKEVVVKINDRGPFSKTRIIDLSKQAAQNIDLVQKGVAEVRLEIVGYEHVNQVAFLKHFNNIFKMKYKNNK